ncbi:hypothetical protein EBA05_18040 [Xanthomonas oryzae pv. oryzae]|nr:hypothetical protein C0L90_17990 [Xanthomonas oryzae pv. oryzae]QBI17110.1 hypothetical protein EYR03_18265 [Xanthomonas oryzae pv. oryzae]QBN23992.1 hypothetical protein EBA00_04620 [Xanthomonas oryzae pv. oryzae]QBN40419.1 hypothetical protein EBA04_18210 [Xanthomonas oryzae pv. oryzae]QBN44065.1 hypothetical protein EBA05_18040 [Xanthomonas oryzae pv. oryzae]
MPPHSEQIVSRICGALFRGSLGRLQPLQTLRSKLPRRQRTLQRLDSISKCNTLSAVRVCTCQKAINTSVRKSAQCSRSRRGAVKVCARFPGF